MEKNLKLDLDRLADPRRSRTSLLSINDEDPMGVYLQDVSHIDRQLIDALVWGRETGEESNYLVDRTPAHALKSNPHWCILSLMVQIFECRELFS